MELLKRLYLEKKEQSFIKAVFWEVCFQTAVENGH